MLSLFGRVLRKRDRLYLAYSQEWLDWAAEPIGTFPTFEAWLITRTERDGKPEQETPDVTH
jgi:hypothetical protein